jgi:hypothetical protein
MLGNLISACCSAPPMNIGVMSLHVSRISLNRLTSITDMIQKLRSLVPGLYSAGENEIPLRVADRAIGTVSSVFRQQQQRDKGSNESGNHCYK